MTNSWDNGFFKIIPKMPLTRELEKRNNVEFFKPMRAIFSGSSQSGKTFLIGKMLEKQKELFGDEFELVKYYYPEYLEESPVNWHENISTPITYTAGFPSKQDILELSENSLLIIDDNMKKVVNSELMRQFFNVISGKRNISIIVVTQNYFTQGQFSRDIRNSSNIVCLFRNCADATLNTRVARAFKLEKAYQAAENEVFVNHVYPYVFIDQSQRSQISNYRVYTDILSRVKIAFSVTGMKGYILNETDFKKIYKIIEEKPRSVKAVPHENTKAELPERKSIKQERREKREERKKKYRNLYIKNRAGSRYNLQ